MSRSDLAASVVATAALGVVAFGQSAAQGIADQRDFFTGLAASATVILGLLGLLYRAFVGWAKQVQSDVNNFGTRLTAQQDDSVRARSVQDADATRRHEVVLAAIQKHADVTASTMSAVQLEVTQVERRVTELETKQPNRRRPR